MTEQDRGDGQYPDVLLEMTNQRLDREPCESRVGAIAQICNGSRHEGPGRCHAAVATRFKIRVKVAPAIGCGPCTVDKQHGFYQGRRFFKI